MKKLFLLVYLIILSSFFIGCSETEVSMRDGIYSAEMEDYSFGWK